MINVLKIDGGLLPQIKWQVPISEAPASDTDMYQTYRYSNNIQHIWLIFIYITILSLPEKGNM